MNIHKCVRCDNPIDYDDTDWCNVCDMSIFDDRMVFGIFRKKMLKIKNTHKIVGHHIVDTNGMNWEVVSVEEQQHLSTPCYEFHLDGPRKVFFVLKRLPNETSDLVEGMYCLEFFNESKRVCETKYLNTNTIRSLHQLLSTFQELIDYYYDLPF